MKNYELFLVSRKNIYCQLYISNEVFFKLEKLLNPYFSIEKIVNENTHAWTLFEEFSSERYNSSYKEKIEQSGDEPATHLYFNNKEKSIMLYNCSQDWKAMVLLRIIRNIFRWEMFEKGMEFIHGGLVSINDHGVAIIGPKGAGKTSTILSLLARQGIGFSTNDDVAFSRERGNFRAYGWPRSIGVRKNTLFSLKEYAPNYINAFKELNHPGQKIKREGGSGVTDIVDFLPYELANCYNSQIVSDTRLDFIVFPKFTTNSIPSVRILNKEDAYNKLVNCFEIKPTLYNSYLEECFTLVQREGKLFLKEMVENTICLDFKQSMDNMEYSSCVLESTIYELIESRKKTL